MTEREIKLKSYKDCDKANQLDKIIEYLEKNEINTDSLKKKYKKNIKNNKLI